MRSTSRALWIAPIVLIGCTNNNIFVTGTVTATNGDSGEPDTGGATDSDSSTGTTETTGTTSDTSTGTTGTTSDTSTGTTDDTSTGDTSTGDTSTGDTSTGDTSTGDTSTGTTDGGPACGDGVQDGDEACDDGNLVDGDGCDSTCAIEAPRWAVVGPQPAWVGGIRIYDVPAGWTEKYVDLPSWAESSITGAVSSEHVYVLGKDNHVIYTYALATGTWGAHVPGPAAFPGTGGFMEWVGNGLCMAYISVKELHCHDGDGWRTIALPANPGAAAAWDPQTNELYVKLYRQIGFQVVDLDTDTLVRTVADEFITVENAFAAHRDGRFYMADAQRVWALDDHGAGKIDTNIPAGFGKIAGDFHPTTGKLYTVMDDPNSSKNALQEYNPVTGVTVTLPTTWPVLGAYDPSLRFQRPKYE